MIGNYIDRVMWRLEVVTPSFEDFKDSEELLVVSIVIQFSTRKSTAEERDWVNIAIFRSKQKDSCDCIVRGVCLDDGRHRGIEMTKDWCCSERFLQEIERLLTVRRPIPSDVLPSKPGERYRHIGVIDNKTSIKVGKS